jgi:hypothetical protein
VCLIFKHFSEFLVLGVMGEDFFDGNGTLKSILAYMETPINLRHAAARDDLTQDVRILWHGFVATPKSLCLSLVVRILVQRSSAFGF